MHRHPGSAGAHDRLATVREFAFFYLYFACVCVRARVGACVSASAQTLILARCLLIDRELLIIFTTNHCTANYTPEAG